VAWYGEVEPETATVISAAQLAAFGAGAVVRVHPNFEMQVVPGGKRTGSATDLVAGARARKSLVYSA
jgi:hypothetical protein